MKSTRFTPRPTGSPHTGARAAWCGFIDVIFPPSCILCHRYVPTVGHGVCGSCADSFDEERNRPSCPSCGRTVGPHGVFDGSCGACLSERPKFAGIARVGEYGDGLAALVRAYKFNGRTRLEPLLTAWLVEAITAAPWAPRVEAVVSVPTHWRHRIGRPLHAADALADRVARVVGLPRPRVLRRVRAGRHQLGLSYSDRAANVRGAFAMSRGVTMKGARLLLVDDVRTTGATLNECARVLRAGGAAEVYAAVVVVVGTDDAAAIDRA